MLVRGSLEEKLQWTFSLYDINGDGVITMDEMVSIVTAIYAMMGRCTEPVIDANTPRQHAESVFRVSGPSNISYRSMPEKNNENIISLSNFCNSCVCLYAENGSRQGRGYIQSRLYGSLLQS